MSLYNDLTTVLTPYATKIKKNTSDIEGLRNDVEHLDVETDTTLSQPGIPADAKAVGDAIASIEPGLSDEAKAALLACFENVAWIDEHGQDYYDALEDALYPESSLPVIRLFVGKGVSGTSLVDNAKRILSEPIPFDNTKPITIRWQGIDGYRYSIKNMLSATTVDTSGTTLYPSQYDYGTDTDSDGRRYEGWAISDDTQTRGHSLDYAAQTWEPLPYNETFGYLRILIANRDALFYDLPSTMPSGYITVQSAKYKIEVKNKNEFV